MKFLNVLSMAKTGLFLGIAFGVFLSLFTEGGAPNSTHVAVKMLLVAVFLTATFHSDEDLNGDWEDLTAGARRNIFGLAAVSLAILAVQAVTFSAFGWGVPMDGPRFSVLILTIALCLLMPRRRSERMAKV